METTVYGIRKKYDRIVGADDSVRPAVGKDGFAEVCGEIIVR